MVQKAASLAIILDGFEAVVSAFPFGDKRFFVVTSGAYVYDLHQNPKTGEWDIDIICEGVVSDTDADEDKDG